MRFICPEIESEVGLSDQILQLYGIQDNPMESMTDRDGKALQRLIRAVRYDSGQVKSRTFLYGRQDVLSKYFQSYPYAPNTARTLAQFSANAGIAVSKNFSDSAEYFFHIRAFLDSTAPFRTNLWYTVFTDSGLYLALPLRRPGAAQVTAYTSVSIVEREDFFSSPGYTGDSSKNFLLNGDFSTVVPLSMNSAQKTRVLNKYRSQNGVMKIWSGKDNVLPCDYFSSGGKVYVIVSKKDLRNGMFEYIGVLEVNESYSFGVTDDNYNVRPYAYTPGIVDRWHYVGAAGEPAFQNNWMNYGGSDVPLRFKLLPDGSLKVEGVIKNGTAITVFTLPAGYRPATKNIYDYCFHWNGSTRGCGRVEAIPSGNVYIVDSGVLGNTVVVLNMCGGLND
jgi:hypothetical protein